MKALAAIALALSACTQPAPTGKPVFPVPTFDDNDGHQQWAFSPDDDLLLSRVTAFAARLTIATGLDISVKAWGVPVSFIDGIDIASADGTETPDGIGECGDTQFSLDGPAPDPMWIVIDDSPPNGCNDTDFTLMHEMIHGLSVYAHASYGLMAANAIPGRPNSIDSDALTLICSWLPCAAYNPERWDER